MARRAVKTGLKPRETDCSACFAPRIGAARRKHQTEALVLPICHIAHWPKIAKS